MWYYLTIYNERYCFQEVKEEYTKVHKLKVPLNKQTNNKKNLSFLSCYSNTAFLEACTINHNITKHGFNWFLYLLSVHCVFCIELEASKWVVTEKEGMQAQEKTTNWADKLFKTIEQIYIVEK